MLSTAQLSNVLALPEQEVVHRGLLSLVEKELRLSEETIAAIRERYDVFSKEQLRQAIAEGRIPSHPAWEDYIVWKNKEKHIERLGELVSGSEVRSAVHVPAAGYPSAISASIAWSEQ